MRPRQPVVSALVLLVSLFIAGVGQTAAADEGDPAAIAAIRQLLATTQPDMAIHQIQPSPVTGLYEVMLSSGHSIYVSADAKFLIPGDLYEARNDGLVNVGESRRNELRKQKIAALDEKDMIVFEAEGERKATLTVFTDVDCPYCRKLHGEVEELNRQGIAVRYLAYPRTGLIDRQTGQKTETYVKMVATWCSEDPKAMMTSAKRGADVPAADCDSQVEEQFELGQEVGVTGTPALVMEDGTIVPGYVPAETLAGVLLSAHSAASGTP